MRRWLSAAVAVACLAFAGPATAAPVIQEFSDGLSPAAGLADIVLGPDGNLWFAEKDVNKLGRLTPGDPPAIDEFDLPAGFTAPFNITAGPDGKIWATATNGAPAVVRIDPSNTADVDGQGGYGLSGSPAGIAAGPDGKIWLGSQGGVLARIDPATMTEEAASDFTLTGFNLRNLAPGPDGNVWATDFGGQIGRVTPTGTVTPFDVPGNGAWDILTGPDGNLWYTAPEGNDSYVGRITPAGAAGPQYPTTDAGDQLGITVGPDGALWFAQAVANDIGRMTLDGQFTQIGGLTAGARPEYIAPGPANTLWFTEKDGNRIGRITGIEVSGGGPPPPPPPPPPDITRPDVTRFRVTRKVFRIGGLGTVIRWTQSEDARVTLRFERRVGRRFRRVKRRMTFQSSAGAHRLRFRGRIDLKHPLRPGRYRMTLRARDAAGNVSLPDRTRFRLLPPRRPRR
jgi:virginiamycin B lyase